jgi:A/G-specific adenine glycosylase
MGFTNSLISWYHANRRDLPWRHTREPYRVWLSEIILQQTRVDQGLAYYYKFLELFPSVNDLAAASEDQVLKAWQGLGYYSRARNLHATAKYVVDELNGKFPTTASELQTLKGVGEYTAAAIASFCHSETVPVIDGNVLRVVSRYLGIELPMDKPEGRRIVLNALQQWIPENAPDTFNQAMMEFGALQCTPKSPSCDTCVFMQTCDARKRGRVSELPFKAGKTKVKDLWMYYLVIEADNRLLVRRRDGAGIWQGLYDFPSIDSDEPLPVKENVEAWMREFAGGIHFEVITAGEEKLHLLSHRRIHAVFIDVKIPKRFSKPSNCSWVEEAAIASLGVSRLVDRYLQQRGASTATME